MSSSRLPAQRLRSHSASSSSRRSRCPADDSGRATTKRAHPDQLTPSSFSSEKWDVDVWRRVKRRRRDISSSRSDISYRKDDPVLSLDRFIFASRPTTPLSATSVDFNLFPKTRRNKPATRHSPHPDSINSSASTEMSHENHRELVHMRSNAFWELHRSVAEDGEGLVRRMRDYECSQAGTELSGKSKESNKKARTRSLISPHSTYMEASDVSDEDEDIQIFAGDAHDMEIVRSPRKKRAHSLDMMDDGFCSSPVGGSETCQSLSTHFNSRPSAYRPDDDLMVTDASQSSSTNPGLSHSLPDSANSSLVSLPLPTTTIWHASSIVSRPIPAYAPGASYEKAIAALSLALANGAGSLNDYSAVTSIQPQQGPEDCNVGELWH